MLKISIVYYGGWYDRLQALVIPLPEDTNLRGSITVQLSSCLFCLDSVALLMLNLHQLYLVGQIKISQTGGQLYSDTYPYADCLLYR